MKDYKRLTERDNCYYDDMTRIDDGRRRYFIQ